MGFYYGSYSTPHICCVDAGHYLTTAGKETPPIDGKVIKEYQFNNAVKKILLNSLKRCGIGAYDVNPDSCDVSLTDRVNRANALIKNSNDKLRICFVSIHYNAVDSDEKFEDNFKGGLEIYHYPNSVKGKSLSIFIHNYLKEGTKQADRGIKFSNFYVLRETLMPAVLSENGFMDSNFEACLMLNEDFQIEVAEEHCKGICDYFGTIYIEPAPINRDKYMYIVQCGAFEDKKNALTLITKLKDNGFPCFLKFEKI